MNTLQTLLLRADWAKSLSYTIDGLMAPWGGFLVEDFRLLKKQFLTKTWNRICTNGHYQICPFIFCLPSFGKVIPLFIFVNFQQLLLCAWASQFTRKSLIKQSILYPLYSCTPRTLICLIMLKSWDMVNWHSEVKTESQLFTLSILLSIVFS